METVTDAETLYTNAHLQMPVIYWDTLYAAVLWLLP
jgi:hypothetical protein